MHYRLITVHRDPEWDDEVTDGEALVSSGAWSIELPTAEFHSIMKSREQQRGYLVPFLLRAEDLLWRFTEECEAPRRLDLRCGIAGAPLEQVHSGVLEAHLGR